MRKASDGEMRSAEVFMYERQTQKTDVKYVFLRCLEYIEHGSRFLSNAVGGGLSVPSISV